MGFYYEHEQGIERLRFTCVCGHNEAMRTKVRRPSGATYVTEFAECVRCCLVYHWPRPLEDFTDARVTAGRDMGSRARPPLKQP